MVELILLIGMFYPQIGLLAGYITNSLLPNDIPLFGDIIMAIFIPRVLFIVYIVMNMEDLPYAEVWFTLHILFLLYNLLETRIINKLS